MRLPAFFHGRRKVLFARLIANGIGQAGLAIFTALLVREVFVILASSPDGAATTVGLGNTAFPWMIGGLLAATGTGIGLRILERQDATLLAENYVTRIRLRLFDALTAGPVLTSKRRSLGPTMLRFVTDLTAVRQWVSHGLSRLIVASLAALGGLIAVTAVDRTMGIAVSFLFAITVILGMFMGNALEHRIRRTRQRRSRLAARIGDRLRVLNVVQLSGRVRRERRALFRNSRSLGEAAVSRARISSIVRVLPDVALGFSVVAVLVIGGMQLTAGVGAYGTIIATLTVLGAISPQVRALGRVFEYWKSNQVATEKLNDIVSKGRKSHDRKKISHAKPSSAAIVFEQVSVAGTLERVDAEADPQSLIAVAGPSGAGKSSLLAAAGRLLQPDRGRILLGGEDITSFTDKVLASSIGMVSADFPLVGGTIRENLIYRDRKASDDQIQRALALCELESEIEKLPKGLKTRIGEGKPALPLGLRQRLALARAVMGDPLVLLLNDPDWGLDPVGLRVLDRILAARRSTVLMATYRLERAQAADAVWYMENGRLVEAGPAPALLNGSGPAAAFFGRDGTVESGPILVWSDKPPKDGLGGK